MERPVMEWTWKMSRAVLARSEASVIGLNCTVGPKPMLDFVEQMDGIYR